MNKIISKIFWTHGVAHNISTTEIEKIYKETPKKFRRKQHIVVLGGDTRQADSSWKYYSAQEAEKLATFIASQQIGKNETIVLLNCQWSFKIEPHGRVKVNHLG